MHEETERRAENATHRPRWGRRLGLAGAATVLTATVALAGAAAAPSRMVSQESMARPSATLILPAPVPEKGGSPDAGTDAEPATAQEASGVALIETKMGYDRAAAAGTGIVLSADGIVLTNHHVIAGSTEVSVTIADGGQSYPATVIGSDATSDIAVLQLEGAEGLTPATLDADDAVAVGDEITAVGNAGGGGVLQAADGTVSQLDAQVTTRAEGAVEATTLTGMIQVDADIVSGDSGGALLDAEGEVIGVNTAASQGAPDITGFAIPIDHAVDTAQDILDGEQTATNNLGYPAFLGVTVQQASTQAVRPGAEASDGIPGGPASGADDASADSDGAEIVEVYQGTPAAAAGLSSGDVITAVDGASVADGEALTQALQEHEPGDRVVISWTDAGGASQQATIELGQGPAA